MSCTKKWSRNAAPEVERHEGDPGPVIELGLELHPVQTEGVQECGQALHQDLQGGRQQACVVNMQALVRGSEISSVLPEWRG